MELPNHYQTVYLAGGCFWGMQAYFDREEGVVETSVGYANSATSNPSYEEVCTGSTHAAETVKMIFDPEILSLDQLLELYFAVIDPTSKNKQGPDVGTQYRTGIYYTTPEQCTTAQNALKELQKKYIRTLQVECLPCTNFYDAEEYHQDYLQKNPSGYCHIDLSRPKGGH